MALTATYSPEDNKLRLYADARLSRDLYDRVRAAGFVWAARQGLFVAPAWTPEREDLLVELCGEVGDEDTTLTERAEERADRFEDYRDKRAGDADRARAAVERITDGIPLGQPILVGHHSERHARRDAERIETGMRRAVKLWETSRYWTDRAAGAIRHAKFKELPAVRARRIKGLEADERKQAKEKATAERFLAHWRKEDPISRERALAIANHPAGGGSVTLPDGSEHWSAWSALDRGLIEPEEARRQCVAALERRAERAGRWLAHLANRLAYERAMLAASGGTVADKVKPEAGGGCRCWVGNGRWLSVRKVNRVSVTVLDNWGNGGPNFTRTVPFDQLRGVMTRAEVEAKRAAGLLRDSEDGTGFYLLDAAQPTRRPTAEPDPTAEVFAAIRDALRGGVRVVAAPQLFPTPPEVARQVVELADIRSGHAVLEPSAGTGNLVKAVRAAEPGATIHAVEVHDGLSLILAKVLGYPAAGYTATRADFLALGDELGQFDRVVMNPPFADGADIRHVEHALGKLKPGGRLVSVVANGPRQRAKLGPRAAVWIDLPAGSFKEQGTNVNAALVVIDA